MTRRRIPFLAIAVFLAWTLAVAWASSRWGATYARGKLPEPFLETPGGLEKLSRPDATLVAIAKSDLRPSPDFEPEYATRWSRGDHRKVSVTRTALADGGLQLVIGDFDGFSGETTTIDLLHGPGGEVLARVGVDGFGDAGPMSWKWERPSGWVLVTRRDWSNLTPEHPLYVRFHIYDAEEPLGNCARGFVRVPE